MQFRTNHFRFFSPPPILTRHEIRLNVIWKVDDVQSFVYHNVVFFFSYPIAQLQDLST
jgi:hypothetical protein